MADAQDIDVLWGAVRGEEIVAKGATKHQAHRAALHLAERYDRIVALPERVPGTFAGGGPL